MTRQLLPEWLGAASIRAAVFASLAYGAGACVQQPGQTRSPEGSAGVAESGATAFVGARILDGTAAAPIEDGVLIVRDGRIDAVGPTASVIVPPGVTRVDVSGKTIIPGLINAHGHVNNVMDLQSGPEFETRANVERQLGLYARAGVTSVFSLGDEPKAAFEVRAGQDTPSLATARLFLAGPVIAADDAATARAKVRENAALKPDFMKIRVDDNLGASKKMPQEAWEAVIDEAHMLDYRVAAHIYYQSDAKALLDRGVDLIAHSIRDEPVSGETAKLFLDKGVCLIPTFTRELSTYVYESTPAFFTDPFFLGQVDSAVIDGLNDPKRQATFRASKAGQTYKAQLPVAMRNMKTLFDAGVPIAMGTDTGPVARFQGYFEHLELEMMVEAGLTPAQALVSATSTAAKCMHVWDRVGALKPGLEADFVVLSKNPLDDVRNTRAIESVWVGGARVPPRTTSTP